MTLRALHNGTLIFTADTVQIVQNDYQFQDNTPPPPTNVLTSATVQWNVNGVWSGRNNVDMTSLSEIIGRFLPNDTVIPWPGRTGSTSRFVIPAGKILCARFDVPAGLGTNDVFAIGGNSYVAGSPPLYPYPPAGTRMPIIVSLSQTQGDFNHPAPFCIRSPINTDAAYVHYWGGPSNNFYAGITQGTWYLNIAGYNAVTGQIDTTQPVGVPIIHTGRIVN